MKSLLTDEFGSGFSVTNLKPMRGFYLTNPRKSGSAGIARTAAGRFTLSWSHSIGRLSVQADTAKDLRLRKINRIRTIRGSLAIEGNTLTEEQVAAILEGKRVLAPPREIREAQNANAAYESLEQWRPHSEKDLLEAHKILMAGLLDEAGFYRHGGVGVVAGDQVIHMAPPADRVPTLMRDLFGWLKANDLHPLVAGAVFHYEFEFIHPFSDGNGRLGRLWQTLILLRWNPLFALIPVESLIHKHQQDYYTAINLSTEKADSSAFVEFMLKIISSAITPQVTPQVARLLDVLAGDMSREEIQRSLGLQDRKSFRARYLVPALAEGLIEMTIPEKPNSRLQKYRLTGKGRGWVEDNHGGA